MITLTNAIQKQNVLISDEDKELLSKWNWTKDNSHNYFYRQEIVNKTQNKIYLHHVVSEMKYKRKLKENECVDHIDGDKRNNTRENIRIVTYKQNRINNNPLSERTNTGFTGITKNKSNLYVVTVNKKQIGKFITIEKAISAKCDFIEAIYKIDVRERWRVAAKSKGVII